jgi:hypothetical protein
MKFPALRRQVVSGFISILVLLAVVCSVVAGLALSIKTPFLVWSLVVTYVAVGYCRMARPDTVSCAVAIYADHWLKVLFIVVVGILLWPVRRLAVSLALLVVVR